jgi:hypothetical protein
VDFAFGHAAGEVVAGTGVPAQLAQGDAVEGRIGLSVAALHEATAAGLVRGGFQGLTPHRAAKDASLRSRSGLSPAAMSRAAALLEPMPQRVSRAVAGSQEPLIGQTATDPEPAQLVVQPEHRNEVSDELRDNHHE